MPSPLGGASPNQPSYRIEQSAATGVFKSKGSEKLRLQFGDDKTYHVAVEKFGKQAVFADYKPELSIKDRFTFLPLKIKDSNGQDTWVKVNISSLNNRLGITKEQLEKLPDDQQVAYIQKTVAKAVEGRADLNAHLTALDSKIKTGDFSVLNSSIVALRGLAHEMLDPTTKRSVLEFCQEMEGALKANRGELSGITNQGKQECQQLLGDLNKFIKTF